MLGAWKIIVLLGAAMLVIAACTTAAPPKADERAAVNEKVAAEIKRICALPLPEREAELRGVKNESGLELYCAK